MFSQIRVNRTPVVIGVGHEIVVVVQDSEQGATRFKIRIQPIFPH